MADLQSALKFLAPVDWADVPQDDLPRFLSECFNAGELLCNSVPPPPNGEPFESSKPINTTPNSAKSAAEMHSSSARSAPRFYEHEELQKKWGKAMKFNKKENPLDIALYKMAGHDRNGAWFARYNVLEGMGFAKFKKAMQREFPETLLEQGPPGAGAKRGLSADRRVERRVEGLGRMEVYQLSAQMPSPVSPREFVTLLLSTDDGLTEKSAAEISGSDSYKPRHFMVVSKPLEHPDTPNRPNFVKGQYESVEMIREIPLHAARKSRPNDNLPDDPELNPVEWIMITRSDPGGGIPRFLVDRGTPEAMLGDVTKLLNWACAQDEIPDAEADEQKQEETSEQNAEKQETMMDLGPNGDLAPAQPEGKARSISAPETADSAQGGIMSTLTSTAAAYAPTPVSNFVEKQIHPSQPAEDDSSDSSDSSSINSFMSAEEMRRLSTAPEYPEDEAPAAAQSTENLSLRSVTSETSQLDKKTMSTREKEVAKLLQQRERLDRKLAKKRAQEQERLKQSEQKEESERGKAKERMEREMKKTEDKHKKEMDKLEAKREKEAKKADDKRKKREDQSKLSLVARERDEARSQLELYKRENVMLSDQVENLQRENTALAGKLGKVGGQEALKSVQDEVAAAAKAAGGGSSGGVSGRKRQGTQRSNTSSTSKISLDSGGSGEKREGLSAG